MFRTAVVWLRGTLSGAKAVSGNTFICPHFFLSVPQDSHPSVAVFLQYFSSVTPERSLSRRNLRSDSSLGMLEKMRREPKKKARQTILREEKQSRFFASGCISDCMKYCGNLLYSIGFVMFHALVFKEIGICISQVSSLS